MSYFTITTNRETALEIEQCFKNPILSHGRSIKLGTINHERGFSTVQIVSDPEEGKINPEDIFWMGYHSSPIR